MTPGSSLLLIIAAASLTAHHLHHPAAATTSNPTYSFLQSTGPAPRMPREKLSHLRFFWHDIAGGRYQSVVAVAQAPPSTKASPTLFGTVLVIDDPMTEAPELSSRLVGRAQGMYVFAAKGTMGLLMAQTFAFTDGKYNGSSITVMGRNAVSLPVREMPIFGGSGLFRWARGYVKVRTLGKNPKTQDTTVEYNVYVTHY